MSGGGGGPREIRPSDAVTLNSRHSSAPARAKRSTCRTRTRHRSTRGAGPSSDTLWPPVTRSCQHPTQRPGRGGRCPDDLAARRPQRPALDPLGRSATSGLGHDESVEIRRRREQHGVVDRRYRRRRPATRAARCSPRPSPHRRRRPLRPASTARTAVFIVVLLSPVLRSRRSGRRSSVRRRSGRSPSRRAARR